MISLTKELLISFNIFELFKTSFDKYLEENFTELLDKLFEKDKTFENYYTMKEVDIKDVVNSDDQVVKFREDLDAYIEDYKKILIKKFIKKMNEFNNETYISCCFEVFDWKRGYEGCSFR